MGEGEIGRRLFLEGRKDTHLLSCQRSADCSHVVLVFSGTLETQVRSSEIFQLGFFS
jgi:hypothetical protein